MATQVSLNSQIFLLNRVPVTSTSRHSSFFSMFSELSFAAKELTAVSVDTVCLVGAEAHEVLNIVMTITQTNNMEVFAGTFIIRLKENNVFMAFSLG